MRKVAVVTTSRADYGLLRGLIGEILRRRGARLQLVVSGMHLDPRFGRTESAIRGDGFPVAARVPILSADDSPSGTARAIAAGVKGFAAAFARLRPDLAVVLGDRFEILAAASAALALRVPLAHLHGGEATFGVIDEAVRHAVTKMSWLHFVAAEPYRRRVIQLGEDPKRVFNSGAPGLEEIARLRPLPTAALEAKLGGFSLRRPFALTTYHPARGGGAGDAAALSAIFRALERLRLPAVFTISNADAGGRALNARLRAWCARRRELAVLAPTLTHREFLSVAKAAAVFLGNSSAGLLEAPTLRVPTVNIGDRQAGRLRAPSVLDCAPKAAAVLAALRRALSPAFRRRSDGRSPYRGGRVAARIARALLQAPLPNGSGKIFHDLSGGSR